MTIRVSLDGRWTVDEFAAFYFSINGLYRFFLFSSDDYFPDPYYVRRSTRRPPYEEAGLIVQHIQLASPGWTDLAGVASAVREVREFLQFCIEKLTSGPDRRLDREMRQLELAKIKVELLQSLADLRIRDPERRAIIRQLLGPDVASVDVDPLITTIANHQVTEVELIDLDSEPDSTPRP